MNLYLRPCSSLYQTKRRHNVLVCLTFFLFSCLRSPSRPSRYIERGYVPPCKRHVPLFPASSREGLPEPSTLHCLSADKRNSRLVASIWRTAGSNCMPCGRPPCCLHLNSGIARSSCRAFSPRLSSRIAACQHGRRSACGLSGRLSFSRRL